MRVSMEIFSIPEEAAEPLRRAVYDSFEKFLYRNNARESETTINLRGGTCPLSGRGYMNVIIHSAHPIDLQSLNLFADSVYAAHPLRDDDLVRKNRFVKIEDSGNGRSDPRDDVDEDGLEEGDPGCWICGRFDGEEYRDPVTLDMATLEVRADPREGVPLCTVCTRILNRRSPIE
jgi:hypothetical protein